MCLELDDVISLKCVSFETPGSSVQKWCFCSHHSREQPCGFILRKLLSPRFMYTPALGQIRWRLRELMCYCFLSMCASVSVRHYQ